MADAVTTIDIGDLHDKIVASISAKFPDFRVVEFYRVDRERIPAPACLLELSSLEPDADDAPDPGSMQLAVVARFEAHLLIKFNAPNAKLQARKLGAAFAHYLRLNRFGARIGPANVIGVYHDDFVGDYVDQYEIVRVEWTNVIHLGETEFLYDGAVDDNPPLENLPAAILGSFVPDIGIGHEADYQPIDELFDEGLMQ